MMLNIITKILKLTLFRMGDKKGLPTSFSFLISTNVEISPKNFLTFSFNPFATLVQNFKAISSPSPKLLNLNQGNPSKKLVFLVKSLQNWGYENFSHRNATTTKLWSHAHNYSITYDAINFISIYLLLKKT